MGNQQNQNPNYGSQQGRKDARTRIRARRSAPANLVNNREPKPGQPNQQNLDR
jgi:hypothetical protein